MRSSSHGIIRYPYDVAQVVERIMNGVWNSSQFPPSLLSSLFSHFYVTLVRWTANYTTRALHYLLHYIIFSSIIMLFWFSFIIICYFFQNFFEIKLYYYIFFIIYFQLQYTITHCINYLLIFFIKIKIVSV